jgi:hypothetical protein
VQAGEALVLELVADDEQLLGVSPRQRMEAAQAEQQVFKAIPGVFLRASKRTVVP